jgi:hypothetical protein
VNDDDGGRYYSALYAAALIGTIALVEALSGNISGAFGWLCFALFIAGVRALVLRRKGGRRT